MNRTAARLSRLALLPALMTLFLGLGNECLADDLGRLFYTPAQRAQLEAARAGNIAQPRHAAPVGSAPVRFDGMVIRSDGRSTLWVNGQERTGVGVGGLKPGQIRAEGKVYEPYQLLRPGQATAEEPAP